MRYSFTQAIFFVKMINEKRKICTEGLHDWNGEVPVTGCVTLT